MIYTVALIGNPNVGKSVIFNNLVPGARQHVGNWPGKTVEKKEGRFHHKGVEFNAVDLPGCYSLTARAIDELIARDFIVEEKPDVVVDIVDASNIERNLYLTLLLLELEANVVIALNMYDIAEEKGYRIDVEKLSEQLGVPIVPTVAIRKQGMEELKDVILQTAERKVVRKTKITYPKEIEAAINSITQIIQKDERLTRKYPVRWLAIRLLEGDEEVLEKIKGSKCEGELTKAISTDLRERLGEDPEIVLAEARYSIISNLLRTTLVKGAKKWTMTDMLDKVFLHKALGIPVFLVLMWATFQFTFIVSAPFMSIIEAIIAWVGSLFEAIPNEILRSFFVDGIFGGLGFVMTFIAPIFFLFFALSILEDSGYLARAAFVMDRLMFKLGLHGKSFIPMLLGFGCNLPAIMATRTIEDEKDRLLTILINPLMSCSARLPVYVLVAGAFWGTTMYAGTAVWGMYILGIVLAILMAFFFRRTLLKGKPAPFIMELPLYRVPTFHGTVIHMWERGVVFLKKAGTYLLGGAIILWFLSSFPWGSEQSYVYLLGNLLSPIFKPLGFGWELSASLIFAFMAKEIVVEALGLIYAVEGETAIKAALASSITPLSGLAFMSFVLIYIPCLATIGVIKQETGSWKWVFLTVLYELILAYVVALMIVVVGRMLGFS